MRLFIAKLFVFVLLICLFCFPSTPPATAHITDGQIVLTTSVTPAEQLPVNLQSKESSDLSRLYLLEFLFGSFLLFIGLATIVLYLFRWKADDLSLIFFGVFCFVYGARTSALRLIFDIPLPFWNYANWFITYLVPIPAWLFVEQFLGKGWKSSIRRLWQIQIAFSIIAIAVSGYSHDPAAAMVGNNIMVIIGILVVLANLFQPNLQWNRELKVLRLGFFIFAAMGLFDNIALLLQKGYGDSFLEGFGFFIFIGCLIYAVAYRFFQNEKELISISHELETARQIQSFILPGEAINIKGLSLTARYVPMASVAGDFYDFAKVDEKRLGILVADVSGHGVPASLISSMVKIAFASNTTHAANPAEVLDGINEILCGKLESDFVTAG
jgi:sigma-B regulation protein RsbU (phosphoserine phosphatase)